MARKRHTKSRYGCKECKQRHLKCDEGRPSCGRCLALERRCSFFDIHTGFAPAPRAATSIPGSSSTPAAPPAPSPASVHGSTSGRADDLNVERYSLVHLELLHHPETHYGSLFGDAVEEARLMVDLIRQEALAVPYLMDEFLALAAAHKSTLVPADRKAFYRTEATRLQNRALSQVDLSNLDALDQNPMAVFLFASLLSQHVMFDILSARDKGGNDLLDNLVHCFGLHRGVRLVAGRAWPQVEARMLPILVGRHQLGLGNLSVTGPGDECDGLKKLIDSRPLSEDASKACREAVEILQKLFDEQRTAVSSGTRHVTVVQGWPVRIPTYYVELVDQRVPESLVILAYYGVLLHRARDYWAIGDTGTRLVQCISNILGGYWARWLGWPRQILDVDAPTELARQ